MKVKFFLLSLLMVMTTINAFSKDSPPPGKGQGTYSITNEISIDIDENDLVVYFNQDIGEIEIKISNALNVDVYIKIVDSATTDNITINVGKLPEGTYNLIFKDSEGNVIKSAYLDM